MKQTFQIPGRLNFTSVLGKIDFYMRELEEKMEAGKIRFPTVEANNWWPASQPGGGALLTQDAGILLQCSSSFAFSLFSTL